MGVSDPTALENLKGSGARARNHGTGAMPTEASLLDIFSALLENWKLVISIPFALTIVVGVGVLLWPPVYSATVSFVPEQEQSGVNLPSSVAGLAAQFGISASNNASTSAAFYANVLKTRTIVDRVMLGKFPDPRTSVPNDSAQLLDILGADGLTDRARLDDVFENIDDLLAVSSDPETNLVTFTVTTKYPQLSLEVANSLMATLNWFNVDIRRSQAKQQRVFVEGRVHDATRELRSAEDTLKFFLEQNRQYESSPNLKFQYDRLQREVDLKQDVVSTLLREYEQSRIDEVNDTPVLSTVDQATLPTEPSSPRKGLLVGVAGTVGLLFGLIAAFVSDYLRRAQAASQRDADRLRDAWLALRSSRAH
jgi:uncharacterized protein involved in exopolysaccharide biosynthesis